MNAIQKMNAKGNSKNILRYPVPFPKYPLKKMMHTNVTRKAFQCCALQFPITENILVTLKSNDLFYLQNVKLESLYIYPTHVLR